MSIRLYRNVPWVTIIIIAINVLIFIIQCFQIQGKPSSIDLIAWGANFSPYTLQWQWWRIFTSLFLHFGLLHLLANMFSLLTIGVVLERYLGGGRFIIIYFLSGVFGALLSAYYNLFAVSVGASGAIFGLYGFDIVLQVIDYRHDSRKLLKIIFQFIVYVIIITVVGNMFYFDNAAHVGGLICGVSLAIAYNLALLKLSPTYFYAIDATLAICSVLIYFMIPRTQVQYFNAFQKLLETDHQAYELMSKDYENDDLLLEGLISFNPRWSELISVYNNMGTIPDELQNDYQQIMRYVARKQMETSYMIRMLQKQSYTYFDSLDIAREGNALDLKYPLAMVERETAQQEKTKARKGEIATEYYDSAWQLTFWSEANYYRVGYKDSLGRWNGPVRDYFINGVIQMKGYYSHGLRDGVFLYYTDDSVYSSVGRYQKERMIGKWEEFHANGQLYKEVRHADRSYLINAYDEEGNIQVEKGEGNIIKLHKNGQVALYEHYEGGLPDSLAYGNYEDGRTYFRELYNDGMLLHGVAYDTKGQQHTYDMSTFFAYPVGGEKHFEDYIAKEKQKYPAAKAVGKVTVVFDITGQGHISNFKILDSSNPALDTIAINIIEGGPEWFPAKLHGIDPLPSQGYYEINFP